MMKEEMSTYKGHSNCKSFVFSSNCQYGYKYSELENANSGARQQVTVIHSTMNVYGDVTSLLSCLLLELYILCG